MSMIENDGPGLSDLQENYGAGEINPFWEWLGGRTRLKLTLTSNMTIIVDPEDLLFDAMQVMPVAVKSLSGAYFNWSFVAAFEPKE